MKEEILFDKLPFLDAIQPDRRQQILKYFRTAPDSLADHLIIENLVPNRVFVREGAPVEYVYLIATGIIKATDYRVFGTEFDFIRFDKAYAMGAMEVLMKLSNFLTTLTTVTKCTIIKIPIEPYSRWLLSDVYFIVSLISTSVYRCYTYHNNCKRIEYKLYPIIS